jgi:hypothetical protein
MPSFLRRLSLVGLAAGLLSLVLSPAPPAPASAAEELRPFPAFEMKEIDRGLGVGYAVLPVDLDGDGKTDLVVVDQKRVVWYRNPDWKRGVILEGQTLPDNVCITAHDIDGDGRMDLALGADWRPFDSRNGGTLQWLKQGKTPDDPWKLYPIAEEPTVHRIRFVDLDGNGKPALVVAPLMGRNSSREKNWMDAPVRILAFRIPKDPVRERWVEEVLDHSLHVVHNFYPIPALSGKGHDLLTASYEGVSVLRRHDGRWNCERIGEGNQATPNGSRGASEVKQGKFKNGTPFIATIEPWHGHQVVVYTPPIDPGKGLWVRHVVDEKLKWGHAVWCADLDGDGGDELVIGVRDNLSDRPGERCGVRVYRALDASGDRWERHLIDEGGVAVEDLACADLHGDGRLDIIAVGRASHNARIYRNLGKK